MAKKKEKFAQAWAIVDPEGNFRSVSQFRYTAIVTFTTWSETVKEWLAQDENKDVQEYGGLSWKQAYRKGWRCVKVWVYPEPMHKTTEK